MSPEAFPIGSVIGGRYVLQRELGRGGAASVFAAEHTVVKRRVALKLPHPDTELREMLFARLRRETEALARVRHPVIVDVIDGGEADGVPFLAMQLIEGRTLSGLVAARGRLDADDVVKIGVNLASGLAAVHAAGILHRDVKPGNVIVTRDPRLQLRLFDFGAAKLVENIEVVESDKLTQSGAILGTVEYMAPEALLSQPSNDHRADIYALGVTLYECLTGAVPFEGNLGQILVRVTTSEPTPLQELRPELPKTLAEAVHRCLKRDPAQRFATMSDVATALAPAATRALEMIDVLGGTARGRAAPPPLPPRAASAPQQVRAPVAAVAPAATPGPAAGNAEARRVLPRAPYVTMASLLRDGQSAIDAKIEDISEGGVLVVVGEPCTPGVTMRLRFALPMSGRIVEVASIVRWSRATRGTRATGFEFSGTPEWARAEIRQYITLMGGG